MSQRIVWEGANTRSNRWSFNSSTIISASSSRAGYLAMGKSPVSIKIFWAKAVVISRLIPETSSMLVLFFKPIPNWFHVQGWEIFYEMLILIVNSFWFIGMLKEKIVDIIQFDSLVRWKIYRFKFCIVAIRIWTRALASLISPRLCREERIWTAIFLQ